MSDGGGGVEEGERIRGDCGGREFVRESTPLINSNRDLATSGITKISVCGIRINNVLCERKLKVREESKKL